MTDQSPSERFSELQETPLTLTGSDQTPVPAILTEPHHPTNRAVILCHGFLSDKNSRTNRRLTELLVPENIATLRFDWYGMGDLRKEFPRLTLHQCLDQLTAIASYLSGRGFSSLGLVGSSFGGFMAILAAARLPHLKAVGLKCPVVDFAECLRLEFGEQAMAVWKHTHHIPDILQGQNLLPLHYGFFEECLTVDGYDCASRMTMPTRVVHGGKDLLIPAHQIARLMDVLPGPKDLRVLPEADHQFGRPEDFRVMTTLLAQWMIEQMPYSAKTSLQVSSQREATSPSHTPPTGKVS